MPPVFDVLEHLERLGEEAEFEIEEGGEVAELVELVLLDCVHPVD